MIRTRPATLRFVLRSGERSRRMALGAPAIAGLVIGASAVAQPQPPDVSDELAALEAAHSSLVEIQSLGTGPGAVNVVALGPNDTDGARDARPAILVVGGFDGRRTSDAAVIVGIAGALATDHAAWLEQRTVYLVPWVNPAPLSNGRVFGADDADRDGRTDEDPPQRIDGTEGPPRMMRVRRPSPLSGLSASLVESVYGDAVLRPATGDERAIWAILPEAIDADGDGAFGEDGPGGINLEHHFPALWPEFADGAGNWPLEVPAARALAEWVLSRTNLSACVVLSGHDSATAVPKSGGFGPAGRVPRGILGDDEDDFETISELFRSSTGYPAASRSNRVPGSFDAWAYAHLGLWSVSHPLWTSPDLMPSDDPLTADADADADVDASEGAADEGVAEAADADADADAEADGESSPTPTTPEEHWYAYVQSLSATEAERYFTPWTAVDHPQLGPVQVGGFSPALASVIPEDRQPSIIADQVTFLLGLGDLLPFVVVDRAEYRRVAGDVYELSVEVANLGGLPTESALGVRARRLPPITLRLSGPLADDRPLIGPLVGRIESLAPGERTAMRWTVRTASPNDLRVTVAHPRFRVDPVAFSARPESR